jgi:MFS family permease
MKPLMSETRTAVIGALIVALGSVSMALYTPAMPTLVEVLQTTPAAIKMSLAVYLFGFAFAQLVCGPLSLMLLVGGPSPSAFSRSMSWAVLSLSFRPRSPGS